MEHHGALGVMRSLGRLGVRVYGVDADRSAVPLRSRYCRGAFIWDIEAQPARASVDFLKSVVRRIGGRPLLLATNDETALFVAENGCRLQTSFVFPDNPLTLVRSLYNKRDMYFLARRFGIPTAETSFPACRTDVVEFSKTAQFPVMLKASDNIAVARRAGKKMVIARTPNDLLADYDAMEDPSNPTMMLQEYIPGGDDSVWMFNGYFDDRSQCRFGITGKKIHQTPVYTGMTALGVCLLNPTVRDQTQRLVAATGYKGIIDIGYRYDCRDGSYKLLDSNPRLGATFRLFVGSGELDVVRAAYLDLTGQQVPDSRIIQGRKWLLEDADIVSSCHYFRDRAVTPRDWIRAYSGIRETAWFAADDLRPFLYVFACSWTRLARRAARLFRSAGANAAAAYDGHAQDREQQDSVNAYFQSSAAYWEGIYRGRKLQPLIYQQRHDTAVRWIERLRLTRGSRILEVGCGAGLLAAELAAAGHSVEAIDSTPAMVDMTRRQANAVGVDGRVRVSAGDVHALDLPDECFDLVVALGVVPWLHSEAKALAEMRRVLKPGGYLLITADNASRLNAILDPISTPALRPLRRIIKALFGAARWAKRRDDFLPKRHRPAEIDRLLAGERLVKMQAATLGYGPFTFCGCEIFGESLSIRIDRKLRALADRSFPGLKKTGAQYLALARKHL